jgi:DNA-binding HxlR family transcriptional regulator
MKCPTGMLIEEIGDRWILHILHQLAQRAQRTQALLVGLKGISSRTLSAKLKQLEADGWITREVYPEVPPRVEYGLTEKGRTLMPLLIALKDTGEGLFPTSDGDCPNCQHMASAQSQFVPKSVHRVSRSARPFEPEPRPIEPSPSADDDVILL